MPAFWLDMSQIATNHFLSSRWVPSIIVPAVTLNWWEHFVHCRLCAWPCTLEQVRFPHAGQTVDPHFSSRKKCKSATKKHLKSEDFRYLLELLGGFEPPTSSLPRMRSTY